MTLLKVLRDFGERQTVHGFRSASRDWVAEQTNFAREVAETALAHAIPNKVGAAYKRSNLFEKRQKLMGASGAYCGRAFNVVRIAG